MLDFWFHAPDHPEHGAKRAIWFKSTPEFDAAVAAQCAALWRDAATGRLDGWAATPLGALALVLLLDQVPRNIFRGSPQAYASDPQARAQAEAALAAGFDAALPPVLRAFLYLPFEHSEDLADQERAVALFEALPDHPGHERALVAVRRHHEIIARFGRFPHRNAVLGRVSRAEEIAFLREPNSSF